MSHSQITPLPVRPLTSLTTHSIDVNPVGDDDSGDVAVGEQADFDGREHGHDEQHDGAPANDPAEEVYDPDARPARVAADPGQPTRDEWNAHMITHHPYRSWCPWCVMGRGRNDAHRSHNSSADNAVPVISFDFCYLDKIGIDGERLEGESTYNPVAVLKCSTTKALGAQGLPSKEVSAHLIQFVADTIDNWGHTKVVFKTDNEPATNALAKAIRRARNHPTILEDSPDYEPQSHGRAERGVRQIKELWCTVRFAFEDRVGRRVPDDHPLLSWMLPHAASLYNNYHVHADGRTVRERLMGKRNMRTVAEFWEKVLYLIRGRDRQERRWDHGIWLGIVPTSNEIHIGTAGGVVTAWTFRRVRHEDRWDADFAFGVVGTTWQPDPG